jgi:hypothetical protein
MFYLPESKKRYYRYVGLLAIVILGVVSILGTGGGGSGGGSPLPTITMVSPAQSSDSALVTALVTAQFNIDMDPVTVENPNNFTLAANMSTVTASSISYDAGSRIVTFTPAADLASGEQYIATISSAVKDTNGNNPLLNDYIWSFNIAPMMVPISLNSNLVLGNAASSDSGIDAAGRYIVFASAANNLDPTIPNNSKTQIYRKDTQTGEVEMVSTDSSGLVASVCSNCESPRISGNGRYVVFASAPPLPANPISQVYRKDMQTQELVLISQNATLIAGNNHSFEPAISTNGRYVAFTSSATNFGYTTNGVSQIYFKDMNAPGPADPVLVSQNASLAAGNGNSYQPDISADINSQYIVFASEATNLITPDGNGNIADIFFVDMSTPTTTELVSVNTGDTQQANAASLDPDVNGTGRYIAFTSSATNLDTSTNGVSQIYWRDRTTQQTELLSINNSGTNGGSPGSAFPDISSDGRYVTFQSLATNLLSTVTNGNSHIFVKDITGAIELISVYDYGGANQEQGNNASTQPAISSDGRYISFSTEATNLVDAADNNSFSDIYRAHNATLP